MSIFNTARSVWWFTPTSLASMVPRGADKAGEDCFAKPCRRTRIVLAPCTTCALVTMKPSGDKITPEPMPRSGAKYAVLVFSFSLPSANPMVRICTTDPVTLADSACTDSLNI